MTSFLFNSLWDFSLTRYSKPQVAETCLQLQDNYAVNVNVLLWALWLDGQRKPLSSDRLTAALAAIQPWHSHYVQPLRQLRRRLKQEPDVDMAPLATLREHIKRAELLAEQQEQLQLEKLALAWPAEELPQGGNLSLYLHYLHVPPEVIATAVIACAI